MEMVKFLYWSVMTDKNPYGTRETNSLRRVTILTFNQTVGLKVMAKKLLQKSAAIYCPKERHHCAQWVGSSCTIGVFIRHYTSLQESDYDQKTKSQVFI